jgi:hypothetical protein
MAELKLKPDKGKWMPIGLGATLQNIVRASIIIGTAALATAIWEKPSDFWPSPRMWDRIMFASVFILVVLGIIALFIFIVRSLRTK